MEKRALCKYEAPTDEYVETLLQQNLTAERCAIARYQQICDMCYGKDYDTFRVSAKILKEELEHEQEIGDYIEDIEETKNICARKTGLTNRYYFVHLESKLKPLGKPGGFLCYKKY